VTLYVDSSAFVKLYLEEADSECAREVLAADGSWVSAGHTLVEVRRALYRGLDGLELDEEREAFARDWRATTVVALDDRACSAAAELAETTGARTLDALHLAAAQRTGGAELTFVTFDRRQAAAARSLGWTVLPCTD
jgi:predicted nucleic acid-binding protein